MVPVPRTPTSLTVSWSAPDNAGKPAITGYDVRYRETDTFNWTTVRQDDAASTSLIITGLRPNAYYDVQVLALNADGSGPWSSTAEGATSPLPETVLANHPLIPGDLGPDDSFRLLFITEETTDATDTGIEHYHDLSATRVIGLIDPGGLVSDWGPISLAQTALLSLPGADARLLTDTTWTPTDRGVPIYWLNGARVADDYADFYDGAWADEANPTNDIGAPHSLADPAPWTGTDHDGTELVDGAASRAVGQSTVGVGAPGSTAPGAGPLNGAAAFTSTEVRPLYGLWHVMVVDENLRLVDNTNVRPFGDEDSDTRAAVRAQLFTTGPHPSGYGINRINVSAGDDDNFLGAVALHTTDTNGKPDLADGLHATLSLDADTYWTLRAPEGTVLKPTTTYALVFQGDGGTYPELWAIGPDRENVAAEGWSLADALLYHDGSSWVENPDGRSLHMEIIGPRMETEGPALVSATVGRRRQRRRAGVRRGPGPALGRRRRAHVPGEPGLRLRRHGRRRRRRGQRADRLQFRPADPRPVRRHLPGPSRHPHLYRSHHRGRRRRPPGHPRQRDPHLHHRPEQRPRRHQQLGHHRWRRRRAAVVVAVEEAAAGSRTTPRETGSITSPILPWELIGKPRSPISTTPRRR